MKTRVLTSVRGEYVVRDTARFHIRAEPGRVVVENADLNSDADVEEFVRQVHAAASDSSRLTRRPGFKPTNAPKIPPKKWPALETKAS